MVTQKHVPVHLYRRCHGGEPHRLGRSWGRWALPPSSALAAEPSCSRGAACSQICPAAAMAMSLGAAAPGVLTRPSPGPRGEETRADSHTHRTSLLLCHTGHQIDSWLCCPGERYKAFVLWELQRGAVLRCDWQEGCVTWLSLPESAPGCSAEVLRPMDPAERASHHLHGITAPCTFV